MILASHGIIGSQITQFVGLLDTYSGAAAAYSLRLLRSAYTGSAIRVRIDTTGQPEYNIGFVDNELDVATLEGYCTGGLNAYVKTWYDQSGNGYDATQTTAENQPQIVSSGSVILENGKPSVDFDGSNDALFYNGNFFNSSAGSGFSVSKFNNATSAAREIIYGLQDTSGPRYDFLITRQSSSPPANTIPNGIDLYIEGNFEDSKAGAITDTNQHLFTAIYSNNSKRIVYNNSNTLSNYANTSLGNLDDGSDFYIGSDIVAANYLNGKIQELILYPSDQSTNRTGIETNINSHYNIY